MTILDHILKALQHAATYNRHDLAKPSVLIWTDGERLWDGVAASIAKARPGFFRLDESGNHNFSGTAAWIRYQLGNWKGDETPVVYLPGLQRHQFQRAAEFPDGARHLFALQFQGQFFNQQNGKDWTPLAFLSNADPGLGLDVARDQGTLQAIQQQLSSLLQISSDSLRGKRVEASDLHDLAVGDSVRMMLEWISDQESTEKTWTPEQRSAFDGIAKKEFGFDPRKDGRLIAAEKLVTSDGKWEVAWSRFQESPTTSFPGMRGVLEKIQPGDLFGSSNIRLPAVNERMEESLRAELRAISNFSPTEARERIASLAKQHEERSRSVWAVHGEAALAKATQHLGLMVESMKKGLHSHNYEALAESYLENGWRVDSEARRAWAIARRSEDAAAVTEALKGAYLPWLQEIAELAQQKSQSYPLHDPTKAKRFEPQAGTILLFIDGFRTDVAKEFLQSLRGDLVNAEVESRWSALPSVTSTAKPAWMPLADALGGECSSEKFDPSVKGTGKPNTTDSFRKLLSEKGWTYLQSSETGDPSGAAWTEIGTIDKMGHSLEAKIACQIDTEIDGILQRISELFEAGWKKVILLTDHGWLWMPGGLPKVDLPKHLTQSQWGRCALPDPQAKHTLPQVPWFWRNEQPVVLAPGVGVFIKGKEYSHGGLTLQECLTLVISLSRVGGAKSHTSSIAEVKWVQLKLQTTLTHPTPGLRIDLRSKAADPSSSLVSLSQREKAPDPKGVVTIFVEDDSLQGQAAVLVVLDGDDVIAKKNLTIGEN